MASPKYSATDLQHHNGRHFINITQSPWAPTAKAKLLKWVLLRKSNTWQVDYQQALTERYSRMQSLPQNRPHANLDDWQVWFVGHATVLLQIGRYNILTDPVWADYVSPKQGLGPKRAIPAGLALEQLPEIHAVLLSHNHYDHMDLATLNWLHQRFEMPIYTGLGNGYYLPKHFKVMEMDWWQSAIFKDLKIIYTPAQHGSGRGMRDENAALWGAFCIQTDQDYCYFAGDTGYADHFKDLHRRLGAPRLALLPIGAYAPRELLRYMHMNPQDAFQAHLDLQAKRSLAIHYRSYQLTDELRDQPEFDLQQVLKNSSKLMGPFYCIQEGRKMIV
ncbi:MBL fold metallo-hydrolase [Acinetobacter larvae]|nr:MBL fold metallo-hydrolase [Acinetobacter larvae]